MWREKKMKDTTTTDHILPNNPALDMAANLLFCICILPLLFQFIRKQYYFLGGSCPCL